MREAQAEGAIDVWLAVEVNGSVDWGTAECLKRYRAIELAAVTGQLRGRHGNRLGLLLFADRPVALANRSRCMRPRPGGTSALGAVLLTVAGRLAVFWFGRLP